MENLRIASAQFEPKDGDKTYNLSIIESLCEKAASQGAEVIAFHELSITAYTHLKNLSEEALLNLSETIPDGPSVQKLIAIAAKYQLYVLAGLVEHDAGKFYNTYVCVNKEGLVAKFRKLHPFISKYLSAGSEYVTFDIKGWTCGILICYDNNVIENVRATVLKGANIIFAPHVTMCTPSPMPGRGYVDQKLWDNRLVDPVPLRQEFDGPKGRQWLMRWLPARAYDNGVYYVFSNPIGMDGEHLKNGCSMILDPYGEVLSEIRSFDNDITTGICSADKLTLAGGYRYRNARRPELYKEILSQAHDSDTKPIWLSKIS